MCGICGIIDFSNRPRPDIGNILREMTISMAHRGPDDDGVETFSRGGFGHRRLAILDVEKSRQPMCAETKSGKVILSFSGEIYNFQELRKLLKSKGHKFKTSGDTEVVLRSYIEWGEKCSEYLTGMFAFAIWDERYQALYLVRDRFGIKPLYYFPLENGLLFGSEPKAILKHPAVSSEVTEDGLRQIFGLVRRPGDAIFNGMYELKPGHWLRYDLNGMFEQQYWKLESRPHADDLERTIKRTRDLLFEIVEQQLQSDVPLGVLLSGGLDSSALTAIAQQLYLQSGEALLDSFSVSFGQAADSFTPDAMRGTLDEPYVQDVVSHTKVAHQSIQVNQDDLSSLETTFATMRARDYPSLGEIDATLLLLFSKVRERCTVALSGEGADELFGGYSWFHDSGISDQKTFPWLAMARQLGRYSMFEPGGVNLDVATYQADLYSDALKKVPKLAGESKVERRMRELTHLHLTYFLPTPLERKDRMSMATGLEVRVPYVDHRLVDYVFNVPWSMKTFDGQEKSLLRAAVGGLLPESVLKRKKSPFPATQDPAYHQFLRLRVQDLLERRNSPALDLFKRPTIRALASMRPTGAPTVRMSLERILAVHDWLVEYDVSIRA